MSDYNSDEIQMFEDIRRSIMESYQQLDTNRGHSLPWAHPSESQLRQM
jgi:hypothetical protein